VGDAAAPAAEGEGGAEDDRQADGLERLEALLHRAHGGLAILGEFDRLHRGPEQAHPEPFEHSRLLELYRQVEGGLPPECGDEGVGPLLFKHRRHRFCGQGLDIGTVSQPRIGHYRCRVGVHQDDPATLLAQRADALHARVVEFAGLTDPNWTSAEDAHGGRFAHHAPDQPSISDFGFRISDFRSPARCSHSSGWAMDKSEIRNPKSEIMKCPRGIAPQTS